MLSKRCFFWKFDKTTLRAKGEHVSLGLNSQSSSKERIFETSSIKSAASEIFPKDHRASCFNCDFCENCLRVKETEKENMSTKGENDSNVSALNNCMCFILFVVMLASNLITWSFAYYPKSNLWNDFCVHLNEVSKKWEIFKKFLRWATHFFGFIINFSSESIEKREWTKLY